MRLSAASFALTLALAATGQGRAVEPPPSGHRVTCNFALRFRWTAETTGYETSTKVVYENRFEVVGPDRAKLAGIRDGTPVVLHLRRLGGEPSPVGPSAKRPRAAAAR